MKVPAKSTRYTSKLTQWHPPVTTPIFCYKQALCQSFFRKALPRKPVANADAHITMGNAHPLGLHAAAVARRTTELSNVEALRGGTVPLVAHPPWEGCKTDKEDSVASSSTNAEDREEEATSSSNPLPRSLVQAKDDKESHTRLLPSRLLNSSQDQYTLPM